PPDRHSYPTRRSSDLIGLSITALSADKLKDQKLVSLEEITAAVPGLVFANSQQNTPILFLRGVGFNESSLGVYPAVSLYVDEIPDRKSTRLNSSHVKI